MKIGGNVRGSSKTKKAGTKPTGPAKKMPATKTTGPRTTTRAKVSRGPRPSKASAASTPSPTSTPSTPPPPMLHGRWLHWLLLDGRDDAAIRRALVAVDLPMPTDAVMVRPGS